MKLKKLVIIVISALAILAMLYVAFVGYLTTNDYRNYVKYCSSYIDKIEESKSITGEYPKNLLSLEKPAFSFRYEKQMCRYYTNGDSYGFTTLCGLIGRAYYNSKNKIWICD